jgi:hypothetical protein
MTTAWPVLVSARPLAAAEPVRLDPASAVARAGVGLTAAKVPVVPPAVVVETVMVTDFPAPLRLTSAATILSACGLPSPVAKS